jgi:hypothetical protein
MRLVDEANSTAMRLVLTQWYARRHDGQAFA